MSKGKVVLCIIGALLVALIALGVWQKDNIQFFFKYWKADTDELQSELDQLTKDKQDALDNLAKYDVFKDVKGLGKDEGSSVSPGNGAVASSSGLPSEETSEASSTEKAATETTATQEKSQPSQQVSKEEDEIVAAYAEKFYALQDTYLGEINTLLKTAIDEFKALPQEKQTNANMLKIATPYLADGLNLEKKCDSEVNTLLSQMEKDLKKVDGDLGVVDSLRTVYKTEKETMRADYLKLLK